MTISDQKFIENPMFLRWIFNANPTIDQYWDNYLLEHPEEKSQLLDLKQRLADLKFFNETLLYSEKEELAKQIENQISLNLKHHKRQLILNSFLKYAAVAIIFTVIGGVLVYLDIGNKSVNQQLSDQIIQIPSSSQEPVLITSNGQYFNLKKKDSSVDYSNHDSVVLNNDSVMQAGKDIPNVMNQLVIPYGNHSKVILSDSTVVWLNSGSRLIYPTRFDNKTREVVLFGEAFFEVTKNPKVPFVVKTSDLSIKVLGTKFNVSSYPEDPVIQTVLKEGSVSIHHNNSNSYEKDLELKPNQMARFNKNSSETKVNEVDVNYYILWTKGLLSFDDDDFNRILKKVERYYNISVRFSEPNLGDIRISGKLDLNQNHDEVLEYLEKVSLTKINKISENQYLVNK